jgi:hypothetical protein
LSRPNGSLDAPAIGGKSPGVAARDGAGPTETRLLIAGIADRRRRIRHVASSEDRR